MTKTVQAEAPIVLDGVRDDVNDTLRVLQEKIARHTPRNLLRRSYYRGKHAAQQVSPVVPKIYQQLAFTLGWSGKAVDLLARRCNVETFVWPGGDVESLGLAEVWDGNRLRTEINQGITSSLVSTSFVVTTVGSDGEPKGLVQFADALEATGTWNPRSRSLDAFLWITSRDDDGHALSLSLYLPNETYVADKVDGEWVVQVITHTWGVPVEPLAYNPELSRPFGSSRISRPVMAIQDQAVRALMRLEGHLDVHAFPDYWMLGADPSIFGKAEWRVMLGRVKGIPDDDNAENPRADVKQFSASSPEPHLAALNAFAKLFARETSLPDTALAITDVSNPTSAESYDASQYN